MTQPSSWGVTMHAVRLYAFGPAENLTYEQAPDPVPGPGRVRIAVAAAGVHLLDAALRAGHRGPLPERPALPTVPGREVAGVVDALGDGVDGLWLGRRVVAHLGLAPGGYAELAVTGVDRVHEIPRNLDFAAAVAMIGTGRTALGIVQFAEPGPEDVVVVPAAAGGVGTLLVQYAKNAGATVVGLAGGPEKAARVRANGADLAVDYTDTAWPAKVRADLGAGQASIVYDGVGGEAARQAVALLGPGGRHLVFGWSAEASGRAGGTSSRASPGPCSAPRCSAGRAACTHSNSARSPRPPTAGCVPPSPVSPSRTRPPRTAHSRTADRSERWYWSHEAPAETHGQRPGRPERTHGCNTP